MKNSSKTQKALALGTLLLTTGFTSLAPASAHDQLLSVTPEANSNLTEAPEEIVLNFSGEIMDLDGANQVRIVDADGNSLTDGEPEVQGTTLTQKLVQDDSQHDTYTVSWRVVSSDGHPIQDSFTYTIGDGASAASSVAPATSSATASEEAAVGETTGTTVGFTATNIAIFVAASLLTLGALAAIAVKMRRR